jgi:predicted permease
MRRRLQAWLEETHGPRFELVRHFLGRFFDSEAVTVPGEWQKVAYGLLAMVMSFGLMAVDMFNKRYSAIWQNGTEAVFRQVMRADTAMFIGLAMGLTALLTVLQWQSLFPDRRDCLVLGSWPVSAREVFTAKFTSLLLIFAVYVMALTAMPAGLFAMVTSYSWREGAAGANLAANFAATAGACVFAFFSLLALQGVLLNLLPGRVFARVSQFAQGLFFITILGGVPLVGRWPVESAWFPVNWFLRLWESMRQGTPGAQPAVLAMAVPAAVTVVAYLLSYRRYQRLLLEGAPFQTGGRRAGVAAWLLERWIREPRRQAAFAFIWKTLARSRSHRLILLAYAGIGLGCITKGALDTPAPSLHDQGMYGFLAVAAPMAIAMAITAGLRYLFSLPVAPGARWLFQTNETEGRRHWLAAVERFVVWCGIAPVYAVSLPAAIALFGWWRAAAATVLGLLATLMVFEILFRNWDKMPFTCSHLPGRQPILLIVCRAFYVIAYLATVGQMILYSSGEVTALAALLTVEGAVWWRLRRGRLARWDEVAICYEETPADLPMSLALPEEVEAGAAPADPAPAPAMFASAGLVASRGLLPAAWEEEIDADRAQPAEVARSFFEDVRYGFRVIRRNPVLSAVVVLTLTVGIGMNASVFTVVNGLALRPHVYKDPASFLRVIPQNRWNNEVRRVSVSEYLDWRDKARSLRELAAWTYFPALIGEDDPSSSLGLMVSCNFFIVEGLDRPILGRLLRGDDCTSRGRVPPAIIAESVWRNRFGADPNIAGRLIQLNSRLVEVAGVVPDRTSSWTLPARVWLPYNAILYFDPQGTHFVREDNLWLALAGRLAPGYRRSQAQAELNILARRHDQLSGGRHTAVSTTDGSWIEEFELTASGREVMLITFFLGAFVLVLLIACANVATLLLSRAATREKEIAVRLSLGAPRIRLVRMLVTESLLLAAIAGVISLYLTWKLPGPLFRFVASGAPDLPMPPDWRIFVYLCLIVLATGLLSGLAPAVASVKSDMLGALKGYGQRGGGVGGARLRGWLVAAQVSMSMALLVEAALFAQSEHHTLSVDPGYLPDRVVVAPLYFQKGTTLERAKVRIKAITGRVRTLAGVRGVALAGGLPMIVRDTLELRPPSRQDATQPVDVYGVSPEFLQTMGIPLLRGRDIREADGAAVVVSQNLARLFWPREDAVGKMLPLPGGALPVVGVAKDVAPMRFGGSENPAVYRLRPLDPEFNFLAVRFDSDPMRGAAAVRAALREADPGLMIMARVLQSWIDQVTAILWNMVSLIVVLGGLATVLAAAGIYGAVSFSVNQRMRELGIRVALGARQFDIVREVFLSAGRPVATGLLLGLWMSVASAALLRRSMANAPIRLDTTNPMLYLGAALVLALAAAAAMIGPAHRGSTCDPLESLRKE